VSAVESVCCDACTEGSRQLILCLVRPKQHLMYRRTLAALLATVWFCGCASEQQRYEENKRGAHLSARAKRALSPKDLDEIYRLIAHATTKRVICLSAASPRTHANAFRVVVGALWESSEFRSRHGLYYVGKDSHRWRILEGGDGLSSMLVGIACEDPPK